MLFYILLFLFGLAAGSFLNVLIRRYEEGERALKLGRATGRSKCPACGKILTWYELVPLVSFAIQRGKCRNCGARISLEYPLVELAGGLVFVLVPVFLNVFFYQAAVPAWSFFKLPLWYHSLVLAWILAFLTLILVVAIDIRHYLIPNDLNLTLAVLGIFITAIMVFFGEAFAPFRDSFLRHYALIFPFADSVLARRFFGFLAAGLFFGALNVLSRGRGMGMGDVKLAAALGILIGWPDIALVIMISFIIGGVWGTILVVAGAKELKDKLPFAPFLVAGFVLVFFAGFEIVSLYLQIFNL